MAETFIIVSIAISVITIVGWIVYLVAMKRSHDKMLADMNEMIRKIRGG